VITPALPPTDPVSPVPVPLVRPPQPTASKAPQTAARSAPRTGRRIPQSGTAFRVRHESGPSPLTFRPGHATDRLFGVVRADADVRRGAVGIRSVSCRPPLWQVRCDPRRQSPCTRMHKSGRRLDRWTRCTNPCRGRNFWSSRRSTGIRRCRYRPRLPRSRLHLPVIAWPPFPTPGAPATTTAARPARTDAASIKAGARPRPASARPTRARSTPTAPRARPAHVRGRRIPMAIPTRAWRATAASTPTAAREDTARPRPSPSHAATASPVTTATPRQTSASTTATVQLCQQSQPFRGACIRRRTRAGSVTICWSAFEQAETVGPRSHVGLCYDYATPRDAGYGFRGARPPEAKREGAAA